MSSAAGRWWGHKVRRFVGYLNGRVSAEERRELRAWLTARQQALFEAMPRADQRHGLDVAAALRRAGYADDLDVLLAGLLHDAGKGRAVRLWHRIAWSLGQRYGRRLVRAASVVPGARRAFDRLDRHAELSADLARQAGAPARTVELILREGDAADPVARDLGLADEGEIR